MSGSAGKKYPVQHKFAGPTDLKVPLAEDLDQEYFKKIASRKGRRLSCYPAVAISDGRIVQTYGTAVPEDVTDLFYAGVETVYCISPAPPSKSNPATNKLPSRHIKKGPERKPRTIDGKNADLDSILGFKNIERREEEPSKQRRQSITPKDRQLGRTPCRSLTSAGTDLSTDKELLDDLRVSLKTKTDSCDVALVDLKNQHPAWASDRQYTADDTSSLTIKEGTVSSNEDTSLYMTNITSNRRQISKGELKKKRLGRITKVEVSTTAAGEMSLSNNNGPMGMSLAISGKVPEAKQVKDASSYQMRQKYADELERNWLENMVDKAKKKKVNGNWLNRRYDLRLDMFYSPEPGDDSDTQYDNAPESISLNYSHRNTETGQKEYVQDDDQVFQQSFNSEVNVSVKFTSRENSISTLTRNVLEKEIPSLKEKRSFLRHFDSTDVLVGNVGELEESSASEIETVLHNGLLEERRCKHKMFRKRRRQKKRFEPFIKVPGMSDDSNAEEDHDKQDTNVTVNKLSVKEIRSMRLKVKKRKAPNIKGLKKFRQIANVIFIFVLFRKRLLKMRQVRKSRKSRKRSTRKANKVKWNNDLEIYSRFERQTSPAKEPIHEKFMREIGVKLLDDMAKLHISITAGKPFTTDEIDTENGEEQDEHKGGMSFYYEMQKVDISDISALPQAIDIRKRERRFSEPGPPRPDHITFKVAEKPSSKKSQRKSRKRSSSPLKPPGRKNQGSSPVASLGKVPSLLPPLLSPPSPGHSSAKSPVPSYRLNHEHITSPSKQKQKCRGRSASPAKRRHSRSPAVENKSTPRRAFKEVTIWPEIRRQRSLSASKVVFKREISLRELLKDADIPAKEIFIQVLERKRKRRRRKLAYAAVHQETRDIERRKMEERVEIERERLAEQERLEEEKQLEKEQMLRHYVSPFVSTGVAWNRKKLRPIATLTNKELDLEITKLSGLFFEMRNCSYIRWSNKDQAILRRLEELENVRV